MKIATYNVNGVNGRLPVLLHWLQEDQPDIVCLQELKAPQDKFPEKAIRDLGYEATWHGQKSWNGVAILSCVGEIHETGAVCPAIRRISTVAIARPPSAAFTFPMAIRSPVRSTITTSPGSIV